jgi:hypothetical protein
MGGLIDFVLSTFMVPEAGIPSFPQGKLRREALMSARGTSIPLILRGLYFYRFFSQP